MKKLITTPCFMLFKAAVLLPRFALSKFKALGVTGFVVLVASSSVMAQIALPASGSYLTTQSYTVPCGVTSITFTCYGGGGAGGGTTTGNQSSGGGGACSVTTVSGTNIQTIVVTIGTGGTGVSGANGNSGNATTVVMNSVTVASAAPGLFGTMGANGAGGNGGTTGTVHSGGNGGTGIAGTPSYNNNSGSGGGGGTANNGGNGNNGNQSTATAGTGGATGGEVGAAGPSTSSNCGSPGITATATGTSFGAGGGGATKYQNTCSNQSGGSGANGGVYITYTTGSCCTNPVITSQSTAAQTKCQNDAGTAMTVTATGTTLTYQWYSNAANNNTTGTSLGTGAQTSSYTPLTTTAGTLYYYCIVYSVGACPVTSAVSGAVIINAPPSISSQSTATQTKCQGVAATAMTVTATGTSLTYQWYSNASNNNTTGTTLGTATGAQTSSYTPLTTTAGTLYYYCIVRGASPCASATSAVSGAIIVNAQPAAVTVATAGTYCTSTSLTATEGSPGTIYWQSTTSGGVSTVLGTTPQTVSTVGANTYYYGSLNAGCWTYGSAAVTINTAVAITGQSTAAQTKCMGDAGTAMTVTATGTSLTYQWYSNIANNNTTGTTLGTATGAQTSGYTPLTTTAGTLYYYCIVSGAAPCASVTSAVSGAVLINPSPTTQATIGAYTNNTTGTTLTANWTRGNGTAGVIVVARLTSTTAVDPASGITHTTNTAFGLGTGSQITGTGNFVVYVGTGTTVNVTALTAGSGYTFTVYEYNTTSTCYKLPGSSSTVTPCIIPTAVSATATPIPVCVGSTLTLIGAATNATTWSWTGPNSYTSSTQSPALHIQLSEIFHQLVGPVLFA